MYVWQLFISYLYVIGKKWKQLMCPSIDNWIKKWYLYTMGYYFDIKNEIVPFVTTWMDLKGIMLSEITQTEKDKHYMISLICGI